MWDWLIDTILLALWGDTLAALAVLTVAAGVVWAIITARRVSRRG